jgi:CheY-like chemotaxis protein
VQNLAVARNLCLILEDNWLIAEGLADQLTQIGFKAVTSHTTCSDALAYLDQIAPQLPDLALLDVTIGANGTSLSVAQKLVELQVPIIIASGHGAAHELAGLLPDVATLEKPVFDKQLGEMVDQVLDGRTK